MRLGLFGGTFDPIHFGHLLLAEQCREQCGLDEIWFLPAGAPPHKQDTVISAGRIRAEMLELAIAGHRAFAVNCMELDRAGTTFTVETLQHLHEENPSRKLFFIVGADSLEDLPTWREPRQIARLATIVAVNRGVSPSAENAQHAQLDAVRKALGQAVADRIQFVTMPGIGLSATDIRQRVRQGRSIRYMTPRSVEQYIVEHRLYQSNMERQQPVEK